MNRILLFLVTLLWTLLAPSCFNQGDKMSHHNYAFLYKREPFPIRSELNVFHYRPDSSRLYFRIYTDHLLYIRREGSAFTANVSLSFRLINSLESPMLMDSGSVQLFDERISEDAPANKSITGYKNFRVTRDWGLLEIRITDLNRKHASTCYINLERENRQYAQHFLLKDGETGQPLIRNYLSSHEQISITHSDTAIKKYFVKYFNRNFPPASPPFTVEREKPTVFNADSLFTLDFTLSKKIKFEQKGLYFIQTDTASHEGYSLFRFNNDYPALSTVDQLLEPVRYLAGTREYEDLNSRPNKKQALDEFWLAVAGNPDRAKELIKKYYLRVQEANTWFTSYLEGWKTDRGMTYIVFGVPNIIYKGTDTENWVYGDASSIQSLNFSFSKVKNPFSDNDYSLNRAPFYETGWYTARNTWREGRVFNDN